MELNGELTRLLTVESRLQKHPGFYTRGLEEPPDRGFCTKLEFLKTWTKKRRLRFNSKDGNPEDLGAKLYLELGIP